VCGVCQYRGGGVFITEVEMIVKLKVKMRMEMKLWVDVREGEVCEVS